MSEVTRSARQAPTRIARASALFVVANLLPRLGLFLLLPVYVRFMSQAEFGALMLLIPVAGLLAILFRLGLDAALMRFHFDADGVGRSHLYASVAATTLVSGVVGVALVATVLAPMFNIIFVGIDFWPLGALMVASALTLTFQYIPTVFLRATEQPVAYLAFTLSVVVATALASLVLILGFRAGTSGGLVGQLAGGIVTVLAAAYVLLRLGSPRVDMRLVARSLRFGIPLVPHGLSQWMMNVSDRWLIGLVIGLPTIAARAEIGIYSLGYQIGYVVTLVAVSVQAAWTPVLYRLGELAMGPRLHRHMVTVAALLFLSLAVLLSATSHEIVAIIAPVSYARAADVISVVALGSTLYGFYVMLVGVIMLGRSTGSLPLITLAAAAVNVGFNLLLIPRLGIMGAAWSTVIGYGCYAGATYWLARHRFPLDLDWPRLSLLLLGALLAVAATLAVPHPSPTGMLAGLAIAMAYAAGGALLCRQPWRSLVGLLHEGADLALAAGSSSAIKRDMLGRG
ncbi:MAG: oligosaccharide flippase family protein [Chloroflexota bacterium]